MVLKEKLLILLTVCCAACASAQRSNDAGQKHMTPTPDTANQGFAKNLPKDFVQPSDDVGRRLLKEYGAVFIARGGARPPSSVVFKNEDEVTRFQASVQTSRETFGDVTIELQSAAMRALMDAAAEAANSSLTITPRGGAEAAKRSYQDTVKLWASRVNPGLEYWTAKGRITAPEARRIRSLSPYEQVPEIFKLESEGIFFAKDLSKSIIYSVAPPGTSQHLSMLALDVSEFENPEVRSILAKYGWHQTVVSDLPHFTYLGASESELPQLGLKKVTNGGRTFWVPEI